MSIKVVLANIALIITYIISAKLSGSLAFASGNVFSVWLPTGLALGFLYYFGYRVVIGLFLGAFLFNYLINPFALSLMIAIGNTLAPLSAYFLLKRFNALNLFAKSSSVIVFIISIIVASLISSNLGVLSLLAKDIIPQEIAYAVVYTWFLGDLMGFLILTPLVASWHFAKRFEFVGFDVLELFIVSALFVALSLAIFTDYTFLTQKYFSLEYIFGALIFIIAFRHHPLSLSIFGLLFSLISIVGTINGYGPFVEEDQNSSLLALQSYIGAIMMASLFVSSASMSNIRLTSLLKKANKKLEKKVELQVKEIEDKNTTLFSEYIHRKFMSTFINLSHHWRQPLNNISLLAQSSEDIVDELECKDSKELKENMKKIEQETKELSSSIVYFSGLQYQKGSDSHMFDTREAFEEVIMVMNSFLIKKRIMLLVDIKDSFKTSGSRVDFVNALINIFDNIIQVSNERKIDIPNVKIYQEIEGQKCKYVIEDNLGGFEGEILERFNKDDFLYKNNNLGLVLTKINLKKSNINFSISNIENGSKIVIEIEGVENETSV
jgi:integral membrane sensor domain MASE1